MIQSFKGGTFLLNVPSGDYRCTAAPYERACMVAALFKKRRVRAKILLLDMNTGIKIRRTAFTAPSMNCTKTTSSTAQFGDIRCRSGRQSHYHRVR